MKIVVSYLNSIYDSKTTIDLLNETSADGIHVDLTDGIYAGNKNFEIETLNSLFVNNKKPLDVHIMCQDPIKFLNKIIELKPDCIYVHPETENDLKSIFEKLKYNSIKCGIAINLNEKISDFESIFEYVDRVLIMSVPIGYGGQPFSNSTVNRLEELIKYKNMYNFEIFVDGGINDETIKNVLQADGVAVGSFICKSDNFENKINLLRNL